MNLSVIGLDRLAAQLDLALLRAAWQGGLAIVLVLALTRALPRLSPTAQSWLWRLVYLKLLIAFVCPGPVKLPLLPAPAPAPVLTRSNPVPASTQIGQSLLQDRSPELASAPQPSPGARNNFAVGVMLVWVLAAAAFGAAALQDERRMRSYRRRAAPCENRSLLAILDNLRERMGIRRGVALLETGDIGVPVLISPAAILLPQPLVSQCSTQELRLILAHELAHLRRGDLLWNRLPVIARVLFFFHPLLGIANREWRHTQEAACDTMAITRSGAAPADYGSALLKVAALCRTTRVVGFAGAAFESYRTLKRRINAMKYIPAYHRRSWAPAGIGLAVLAIAGLVPWRVVAHRTSVPLSSPQAPIRRGVYPDPATRASLLLAANPASGGHSTRRLVRQSKPGTKRTQARETPEVTSLKARLRASQAQLRMMAAQYQLAQRRLAEVRIQQSQAHQKSLQAARDQAAEALNQARSRVAKVEEQYRLGALPFADLARAQLDEATAEANLHPGPDAAAARIASAKALLQVAQSRYEAGLTDTSTVEDAQRQVALAEAALSPKPELAVAAADFEYASKLLDTSKARYAAGAVTWDAVDAAQKQFDAAKDRLAQAKGQP